LKSLREVGRVIAQKIIEYQEAYKGFKTLEKIKMVDGIADKK